MGVVENTPLLAQGVVDVLGMSEDPGDGGAELGEAGKRGDVVPADSIEQRGQDQDYSKETSKTIMGALMQLCPVSQWWRRAPRARGERWCG